MGLEWCGDRGAIRVSDVEMDVTERYEARWILDISLYFGH